MSFSLEALVFFDVETEFEERIEEEKRTPWLPLWTCGAPQQTELRHAFGCRRLEVGAVSQRPRHDAHRVAAVASSFVRISNVHKLD